MADQSDVADAFVALISGMLYPNGTDSPSSLGLDAKVYVGWPVPSELKADLMRRPSVSHISVYPRPDEHNTTRYDGDEWLEASRPTPTLTLTSTFNPDGSMLVTIGGTVPPASAANPQNLAIFVNGVPYLYTVQPTDTLMGIAEALATKIAAAVPGTLTAQAAVWLPAGARLGALRVGVTGTALHEVGRQEKLFQIGIWSATPRERDKLASAVDVFLRKTQWLNLADQTLGRNIYRSSHQSDQLQREGAYRRDLLYTVEYATTEAVSAPEIIVERADLSGAVDGASGAPTPLATTYS